MSRGGFLQLAALIDHVARLKPHSSPLSQLSTAVEVAADAVAVADDLIDHFVDGARKNGSSWTEIGAVLGVSRQAAQQRFADFDLSRMSCRDVTLPLTPAARRAIRQAQREARRTDNGNMDTEHLLAGLLQDGRVLAVKILQAMGVTPADAAREADRQLGSKMGAQTNRSGMIVPGLARALRRAVAEAEELGHDYVGTEHLLLGLLREPGAARDVITALGGDYSAARSKALEFLAGPQVDVRRGRLKARIHD